MVVLAGMSTKGPPEDIFPLIYSELRKVARRYLSRERKNHTLQPTALVNEAWLRLENQHGSEWQGRTHGLALAAQAMRRLLVDHGRHQKRQKRGGGAAVMQLDELVKAATTGAVPVEDLLTLEAALTRLEASTPGLRRWCRCDSSPGCRRPKSPRTLACRSGPWKRTGPMPARGSSARCPARATPKGRTRQLETGRPTSPPRFQARRVRVTGAPVARRLAARVQSCSPRRSRT